MNIKVSEFKYHFERLTGLKACATNLFAFISKESLQDDEIKKKFAQTLQKFIVIATEKNLNARHTEFWVLMHVAYLVFYDRFMRENFGTRESQRFAEHNGQCKLEWQANYVQESYRKCLEYFVTGDFSLIDGTHFYAVVEAYEDVCNGFSRFSDVRIPHASEYQLVNDLLAAIQHSGDGASKGESSESGGIYRWTSRGNGQNVILRSPCGRTIFLQDDDATHFLGEIEDCQADENEQFIIAEYFALIEA